MFSAYVVGTRTSELEYRVSEAVARRHLECSFQLEEVLGEFDSRLDEAFELLPVRLGLAPTSTARGAAPAR